MLGVGLLAAAVGAAGWRARHRGAKLMSVIVLAGTAALTLQSGHDLIREVRAAGPYAFSNPAGGELNFECPDETQTITNESGVPLRITFNGNAAEAGTCQVGTILQPGQSCTAQPSCPTLPPIQVEVLTAPTLTCGTEEYASYPYTTPPNNYTLTVLKPIITPPTFGSGPVITWSSTPNPAHPRSTTPGPFIPGTGVVNQTDLTTFDVTVTATAPAGYGFDSGLVSTKSWNLSRACVKDDGGDTPGWD